MGRRIGRAAAVAAALLAVVAPAHADDGRPLSWVVPQSSPWVGTLGYFDQVTRLCLAARSERQNPPKPGEPPVILDPAPLLPREVSYRPLWEIPCRKQGAHIFRTTQRTTPLGISLPSEDGELSVAWRPAGGRRLVPVEAGRDQTVRFGWWSTLPGRRGHLYLSTTYRDVHLATVATATVRTDWVLRVEPARRRR
jgi:hypothetical protein